MKAQTRLYLASASPRRRLLVQALGLPVTAGLAPVDEEALQGAYTGPSDRLAEYLARCKAISAARTLADTPEALNVGMGGNDDDALVVGADTTVLLDDQVLGKPADPAAASDTLRQLRGRAHMVVTGVALARPAISDRPLDVRCTRVMTHVTMRAYSDDEIADYVATGDPLDKAGAYAVQHGAFRPVAHIKGCYTAVVGLPLCALAALVAEMSGIAPQPQLAPAGYPGTTSGARAAVPSPTSRCPWSNYCRAPLPHFVRNQAR